jgi:hypothetical protein
VTDSPPLARADRRRRLPSAHVVRFPGRRARFVSVYQVRNGTWLVLARGHGWLHPDRRSAIQDARWLAWNLDLPIRDGGGSA